MKAFVWRSGLVKVGEVVPDGAIEIADGDDAALRTAILAFGVHAYDGETILVPGLRDAENDYAAFDALFTFQVEVNGRLKDALWAARS